MPVGAYLVLGRSRRETTGRAPTRAPTTAEVVRRDLAETDSFDGTLGYASTPPVVNQLQGTITALARRGASSREGRRSTGSTARR